MFTNIMNKNAYFIQEQNYKEKPTETEAFFCINLHYFLKKRKI